MLIPAIFHFPGDIIFSQYHKQKGNENMAGNLFFGAKNSNYREENIKNSTKSEKIVMISPYDISPNPSQPRKYFTDEAIFRLADSIRNHGLIQPLTVRKTEKGYELIAGERRLRALKILGENEVPCVISNVDNEESAHLAIIENIQRENLNMFEQASAILNLMKVHCLTQEKIAEQLSCSQSYVANKLRLLKISDEEKEIIIEYGLTERHARALLRLKNDDLRRSVLKTIIKKNLNVSASEDYIERLLLEKKQEKKDNIKTKIIIKDMRLFYNTIDKAIETMRSTGFDVETTKRETSDSMEIIIAIPKCST